MPYFTYKAVQNDGEQVTGEIESTSRKQAVSRLFSRGLKPISISSRDIPTSVEALDETINFYGNESNASSIGRLFRIKNKNKITLNFLQKLNELLSSGLPPGDAVRLLSTRLSDPLMKDLANRLWRSLSEGHTLAASMQGIPEYFHASTVHLVEAGEASGNLSTILERIVRYLEESAELRSRVLSGLAYPGLICSAAFFVVAIFLFVLLPKIQNMMDTLGGEMNFFVRIIIDAANFGVKFGPFIILGLIIFVLFLVQWRKTQKGREVLDFWQLKLFLVGRIFLYSEVFQTSSLLSTLMGSGVNTTEALKLVERTIDNTQMRRKFAFCRQQIQEGLSMGAAFGRTHFMPDTAIDILAVGENTGNIVHSLNEISGIYRKELTRSLQFMTTAISSGALIFAFLLVTLIALGLVLSVFQISNVLSV